MRTLLTRALPATVALAGLLAYSTEAKAAIPPELAPGTKPHYFEFGPTFGWGFGRGGGFGGHASAMIDYRYHFFKKAEGPSLGVMSFVGGWSRWFRFAVGPMFEWDFKLIKDKPLGLYLGPHVTTGYAFNRVVGVNAHYGYAMAGPTLKLIVNNFWVFWVRPANLSINFTNGGFYGGWSGALGAGITFG